MVNNNLFEEHYIHLLNNFAFGIRIRLKFDEVKIVAVRKH